MTLSEGTVTRVIDDDGIIVLQVQLRNGSVINAAFGKLSSDFIVAPEEGDIVAVQKTDSGKYVAHSIISKSSNEHPEVSSGSATFQFDENNFIRIGKQNDDSYKLTIEMEDDVEIKTNSKIIFDKP